MTAAEAIAWTTLRAVAVAVFWAVLAPAVAASLRGRPLWTAAAVLPIVTPGLAIGYVDRPYVLAAAPWVRDAVHAVLMAAITLPLAVFAARFAPPTVDARGRLAWALRRPQTFHTRWLGAVRIAVARHRPGIAAALVAFLWTMQEAELGILLQARGWTEWTQRQLVGGRVDLLGAIWPVLAMQAATIAAGLWFLRLATVFPLSPRSVRWPLAVVAAAVLVTTVHPVASLLGEAVRGVGGLTRQTGLVRTLGWTLTLAAVAAIAAWGLLHGLPRRGGAGFVLVGVVAVGGCGSLLLAVLVREAVRGVAPSLLGTPLPHVLALTLSLGPKAVAVAVVAAAHRQPRAIRAAELIARRSGAAPHWRSSDRSRLLFALRDRPAGIALAVLTWTAYFEVMPAVVLAAPGLETAPLQLYNFAHFNQIVTLAAYLLLAAVVPLAAITVAMGTAARSVR